ncbi:MAG: TonB-dependent receptor [Bacteroidia bacterium]|nr:TonB-dependent receptor [Bacteroidia bacterium]
MKRIGLFFTLQLLAVMTFAQLSLTGIVKDEKGEALSGANVLLANTFNGTTAGINGEFKFPNLPKGKYTIVVTFIGYHNFRKELILNNSEKLDIALEPTSVLTEEVLVSASRAGQKSPVAHTNIGKEEIQSSNLGQDIPFLMNYTPSFVATSDAGNGVGYTNFRIRGTDLNRINVTINGIPMSEAESHSTYFVDIPDLAASTENIQIQRGVGNSTNGAGAFGATIDLQTSKLNPKANAGYNSSVGSFSTFRNNLTAGTGLINGKFAIDASLSKITSAGFVDRGASDLKSFFISGGYFTANTILKATIFSGFEETYQAWNGVPSVRLNNDLGGMQQYEDHYLYTHEQTQNMINSDSRTYNLYTYKNQVDHYQQDHYQLHFSHKFNPFVYLNAAAFYTYGRGYYEQYETDQKFEDYQLANPVINGVAIKKTDLIRRKWLDNDFYGMIFSLSYKKGNSSLSIGGGANVYDGHHFGRMIWAKIAGDAKYDHEWYRGTGLKKDDNIYARYNYQLSEKLNATVDLQYRYINYDIGGIDDNLRNIIQHHKYNFFNPKFGLFYSPGVNQESYLSFSRANREPNRDNFVDADPTGKQPTFETLNDFELGYTFKSSNMMLGTNLYYMHYNNQLILTGQINNVGSAIMTNVDRSYREGIELMAGIKFLKNFNWNVNATISRNKISDFTEYVEDWDNGGLKTNVIGKTDLAFAPQLTASSVLSFKPSNEFEISFLSNYVGKQYIDNTASNDRKLDAYLVNNLKFDYTLKQKLFKELKFNLLVNNIFNEQYESNAWVYSYFYEGKRNKMDGYFPQAGTNFILSVSVGF